MRDPRPTRHPVTLGLAGALLGAAVTCATYALSPRPAIAQTTGAPAVSATSAPAASATGAPSGSAPAAPPAIRGADIPTERSEPPKPAEWKDARKVTIPDTACDALMLREYLRVSCLDRVAVAVVAGDTKDTRVLVDGKMGWDEKNQTLLFTTAHVVVPLRRGESTLATFRGRIWRGDYMQTFSTAEQLVIAWREGEADPLVALAFTEPPE